MRSYKRCWGSASLSTATILVESNIIHGFRTVYEQKPCDLNRKTSSIGQSIMFGWNWICTRIYVECMMVWLMLSGSVMDDGTSALTPDHILLGTHRTGITKTKNTCNQTRVYRPETKNNINWCERLFTSSSSSFLFVMNNYDRETKKNGWLCFYCAYTAKEKSEYEYRKWCKNEVLSLVKMSKW